MQQTNIFFFLPGFHYILIGFESDYTVHSSYTPTHNLTSYIHSRK